MSHIYTSAGVHTGVLSFVQIGNGSSFSCSQIITGQINGICGSQSGAVIYDFDDMGNMLSGGSNGLCASGMVTGFVFDNLSHEWSWLCLGSYGGSSMSCGASENYCGNGDVEAGNGEQCDSEIGCNNATCQRYTADCSDVSLVFNPAVGVIPFNSVL